MQRCPWRMTLPQLRHPQVKDDPRGAATSFVEKQGIPKSLMQANGTPCVIALAGGSGSGKSTLVKEICAAFGQVALLDQDSYYFDCSILSMREISDRNFDHPSSIDQDLQVLHLRQLLSGQSADKPRYCFESHRRDTCVYPVGPASLVLVEGTLVLWNPALRSLADLKIFVDVSPDIRFIRRLQRDIRERGFTVESSISQYLESVRPMHEEFVEPTKTVADLLVDGTRPLTEIVNQIREALDGRVAGVGTGSTLESREARRHGAKLNVASRFNVAQAGEE